MAEKKATKETMEEHFAGKPIVGMTKTGEECFPSEKLSLAARPVGKSDKGEDFKGEGQGKE